jgi:hypothetical protein
MLAEGYLSFSKSASFRDMRVAWLPWSRIAKIVCAKCFTFTTSLAIVNWTGRILAVRALTINAVGLLRLFQYEAGNCRSGSVKQ